MRHNLIAAFIAGFLLSGMWAFAQTCLVLAPVTPPAPPNFNVACSASLADGGYRCTITAFVPGAPTQNPYVIGPVLTGGLVQSGMRAAAKDNGWDDGGVP
jgi:hypothetical protein